MLVKTPKQTNSPVASVPDEEEEETEPVIRALVVLRPPGSRALYGLDTHGNAVQDRGNQHWFGHDGTAWPLVWYSDELVSTLPGWKTLARGVYEYTNNDDDICSPQCPFELVQIPEYRVFDTVYPRRDALICHPLLDSLNQKFPNPVLSVSNMNAFSGLASREFHGLCLAVEVDTISYFASSKFAKQELLLSSHNSALIDKASGYRGKGLRSYTEPSGLDAQNYLVGLGQNVDYERFHRGVARTDTIPPDLTENGKFLLNKSSGYTQYSETGLAGTFKTETNQFPKLFQTIHLSVRGVKEFQVIDADGQSTAKALSRLYKARPDEITLQENQATMLNSMVVDSDLLSFCANDTEFAASQIKTEDGSRSSYARLIGKELPSIGAIARHYIGSTFATHTKVATRGAGFMFRGLFTRVYFLLATLAMYPLYYTSAFLARLAYVGRTFPKKKLYTEWWKEIQWTTGHSYSIPIRDPVEAKFKTEMAKPGKHGRLYVTYGRSILHSGWIYEHVKKCLCNLYSLGDGIGSFLSRYGIDQSGQCEIHLVKSLEEDFCFDDHVPAHGLYARAFSDDMSSIYTTETGEVLYFDTDISSCDAGNGFAIFYLLAIFMKMVGFGMYIKTNFSRLREKITLRNPSNRKENLVITPRTIYEGSGCPETTCLNFIASYCILISTYIHVCYANSLGVGFDRADETTRTSVLVQAAAAVGHVISVDWHASPADTQFLKYSPLIDTQGDRTNTRNLGTYLRGYGRHFGDITAVMLGVTTTEFSRLSVEARGEIYMANVIRGLCNEPGNVILDAMRSKHNTGSRGGNLGYTMKTSDRSGVSIPISSLQERYGGEEWEWLSLAADITRVKYGQVRTNTLVDRILSKDYGL